MPRQMDIEVDWSRGQIGYSTVGGAARADLVPGRMYALDNVRVGFDRALWPRRAWQKTATSGAPSSVLGRGIAVGWYESGKLVYVTATKDSGNAFSFVKSTSSDGTPANISAWSSVESALTITTPYTNLPVAFAVGGGKLLYTNPGFPSKQARTYDGTTVAAVATSNIAGRCAAYHLSRFWMGGSVDDPTYVRFSEIGDPTNWNTSENFIPVEKSDGLPVEAVVQYDRGLVIGKRSGLWWLGGSTLDSFQLLPIYRGDEVGPAGAYAMASSDRGLFWVGASGYMYRWDGGSVRRLTDIQMPTGSSLDATTPLVVTAPGPSIAVVGKTVLADGGTVSYAGFDLDLETSWNESYVSSSDRPVLLNSLGGSYLLCQPYSGSSWTSPLLHRDEEFDSGLDFGQDPNHGTNYYIYTPWYQATDRAMTLRSVWLSMELLGYSMTAGSVLTVQPYVDGAASAQVRTVLIDGTEQTGSVRLDFALPLALGSEVRLKISYGPITTAIEQGTIQFRAIRMRFLVDEGDR